MTARRLATCPTCNHSGEFSLLGVQKWPPQVAEKLGLPSEIPLWSCPNCQTTISDPDLLPYQGSRPATSGPMEDEKSFLMLTPRNLLRLAEQNAVSNS